VGNVRQVRETQLKKDDAGVTHQAKPQLQETGERTESLRHWKQLTPMHTTKAAKMRRNVKMPAKIVAVNVKLRTSGTADVHVFSYVLLNMKSFSTCGSWEGQSVRPHTHHLSDEITTLR
jgi:hypothetical protein